MHELQLPTRDGPLTRLTGEARFLQRYDHGLGTKQLPTKRNPANPQHTVRRMLSALYAAD